MKSFKEFMTENGGRAKSLGGDGGHGNQYGRWGQEPVHLGIHRIEDPNVLQRLNAHVGLINTREYIDPRSALEHVQNALMRLGYHFEYNLNDMPSEQNVYPLNRFGGRTGFIDMDAVVKEDDGIENSVGESMVLRVEFVQDPDTARYEVFAQIVPASLFDEEEVQPDAIRPNRAGVPSTTGDSDGINMGEERQVTDPKKLAVLRGKAKAKGLAFRQRNQRTQADNERRRRRNESVVYIGEAVSISAGQAKGQGTFEVVFDFRGGPTRKQAQKFALAAQKRLAGASFTPNRSGSSEKVVVTVKAGSPRDAQVKARNVLDGVKESVDQIFEAQKFIVSFPTKTNRNQALADVNKLASGLRTTASALFPGAGPPNGVFFSVSDNGTQTRDLMKLIKKNKGTVASQKVESVVNEELSRTFAFPSADARNRVEKLLGLASRERVTTTDTGKGKFKFTVTAILKAPQIARVMNSVKQLKGKLAEEQVNEDISRTFAFPSADARNRVEKLLGLASREQVNTSDKGKGKFKFTVTAMLKQPQIAKIMNSVKQLKGIVEENSPTDIANDAVRAAIRERAERSSEKAANQTRARILASRDKADKAQSARRSVEANPKITLTRLAKRLKTKRQSEACDLSHDENAKENRRTRKDNKLASGFKEQLSKRKKKTTSY